MRSRIEERQDAQAELHDSEHGGEREGYDKPKVHRARAPSHRLDAEHDEGSSGSEGKGLQEGCACWLRDQQRPNVGRCRCVGRADNDAQCREIQPQESAGNLRDRLGQGGVKPRVRSVRAEPDANGGPLNGRSVLDYCQRCDGEDSPHYRPQYCGPDL